MAMTHAAKMALVPQEMMERFQHLPDPSPATKATLALDTEMKNILDRTDIAEDEKVKLYNQTLSRYLTLDHQRKQPLEMKLTSTSEDPVSTSDDLTEQVSTNNNMNDKKDQKHTLENDVLGSVPVTLRKKAERLLKHLKSDRNIIDWNQRGEIIAEGNIVKGSHLIDLIKDTLRKRKDFNPRGWKEFNKALAVLNTPQDLVGNSDRWQYQQSGEDHSFSQPFETYNMPSGLFAEAPHLKHISPKQKTKKKKRMKHKNSFDFEDDMVVSSTTSPHRWNDY